MPERTSSNDLLFELLQEIVRERQRDMGEGITLRALNKRFDEHLAEDERRHEKSDDRIRKLEEHAARSEAHVETGRFIIPPPPIAQVTINGNHSKRPTITKGLKEAMSNPIIKWVGIALALAASHLAARCGIPPIPR
jgi:hypothetical protein